MGLSRTVSKMDGDFSRKLQNFLTPVYFAPADGVPLGIWYWRRGQEKTGMMGLPDGPKRFKISLAV